MRAQGALSYIVIIAAILSVSTIVVLYVSGVVTHQSKSVSISSCRQTASQCKLSKMTSPTAECPACIDVCMNATVYVCGSSGTIQGITHGAVTCCQKGLSEEIYTGSKGCGTPVHISYGSTLITIPSDWEPDKASSYCAKYPELLGFRIGRLAYSCAGTTPYNDFYICPQTSLYVSTNAVDGFDMVG